MEGISVFLFACVFTLSAAEKTDVVETNYGPIQGSRKTFQGQTYEEFLGIPFAAPPVGLLRWFKPTPPAPWSDVRECTKFATWCKQVIRRSSEEDCLYLNVYVPGKHDADRTDKLPVMVWIHGGAFFIGSSSNYVGYGLALKGDVIVVSVNYRLGAIGFLSTSDKNSPGNYGLWDQIEALKWVQENIGRFGGDPDRVTIFGQSAGSAAVSHLALSPQSKGLVHRAILLSGSANAYWSTTGLTVGTARAVALSLGCPPLTNRMMVNCLMEKEATSVDDYGMVGPVVLRQHLPNWVPVVDGEDGMVPVKPIDAMQAGQNADIDLIIGYANDDGAMFAYPSYGGWGISLAFNRDLLDFIMRFILNVYSNRDELADLVYEQYPEVQDNTLRVRAEGLVRLVTDFLFEAPAHYEALEHARTSASTGKRTYMYEYHHRPSFMGRPDWIEGVHADDVFMVFGEAQAIHMLGARFRPEDQKTSDQIIGYYSNFAYTGNPNQGPHSVTLEWPEYSAENNVFLVQNPTVSLDTPSEKDLSNHYFWNEVFFKQAVLRPQGLSEGSFMGKDTEAMRQLIKPKLHLLKKAVEEHPDDFEQAASVITEILLDVAADMGFKP